MSRRCVAARRRCCPTARSASPSTYFPKRERTSFTAWVRSASPITARGASTDRSPARLATTPFSRSAASIRTAITSAAYISPPRSVGNSPPTSCTILIGGRILQEDNTWNLPIPIIVDNGAVKEFPGFNIHTGAIGSPQERELTLRSGDPFRFDRGRGTNIKNGGCNFNYNVSDNLSVQEKASYLEGAVFTNALFPNTAVSAAALSTAHGGTFGSLTNTLTGAALP